MVYLQLIPLRFCIQKYLEEIFGVEDPTGHVQQVMEIKIQGIIQGFGNEGMDTKREEERGRETVRLNNLATDKILGTEKMSISCSKCKALLSS